MKVGVMNKGTIERLGNLAEHHKEKKKKMQVSTSHNEEQWTDTWWIPDLVKKQSACV